MKRTSLGLIPVVIMVLGHLSLGYSERGVKVQEKRFALVIGNGSYKSSPLRNPTNDAHDMAFALKTLGFEVTHLENAEYRAMERAIRKLGKQLRKGGAGLFYFAGHGIQVNGRNYLIPVDAEIETESDVKFEAVDAGRVLGKMEDAGNELNIVILDACRDNPYSRSFRSGTKGLVEMDALRGAIVAYATAPGMTAADGDGRNGIYTKHLLINITKPGLKIEDVFKNVRIGVLKETNNQQIPWESSSLTGDLYLNTSKMKQNYAKVQQEKVPVAKNKNLAGSEFELQFWNEIKDSEDPDLYEAYIEQFPNGVFSKLARYKLSNYSQKAPEPKPSPAKKEKMRTKLSLPEEKTRPTSVIRDPNRGYRLAIFPLKLHRDAYRVKHGIYSTINDRVSRIIEKSDQIPKPVLENLLKKDIDKSIWSVNNPNLDRVIEVADKMGFDAVLLHYISFKEGQGLVNGWGADLQQPDIKVYLVNIPKRKMYTKRDRQTVFVDQLYVELYRMSKKVIKSFEDSLEN